MYNPKNSLKAIPSLWSNLFEDKDMLLDMYSYLGTYLGDTYGDIVKKVSSVSLQSTPLLNYKTWHKLQLRNHNKLYIPSEHELGVSLCLFGLTEEVEDVLVSASRIYNYPHLKSEYLTPQKDYEILDIEDPRINTLAKRFYKQPFFDRFDRFIVFYDLDPQFSAKHKEPITSSLFYPLTFEVLLSELTQDQIDAAVEGKTLFLKYDGYDQVQVTIALASTDSTKLYISLSPEDYSEDLSYATAEVTGLTSNTLTVKMSSGYSLPDQITNLWCFNASIDSLDICKAYKHLSGPSDSKVRSTANYKNLLEEILAARMLGLSSKRLSTIGDILAGSEVLNVPSLYERVNSIDLVSQELVTNLSSYPLIKGMPINYKLANGVSFIHTESGIYNRANLYELKLTNTTTHKILLGKVNNDKAVSFSGFDSGATATAILFTDRTSVIVYSTTDLGISSNITATYTQPSGNLLIPQTSVSVAKLEDNLSYLDSEVINPQVIVKDFNTSSDWWYTSGIHLPSSILEATVGARSLVSPDLWEYKIGSMPAHKVGDYLFTIPTDTTSKANSTAYLITRDFLQTKMCTIEYATTTDSRTSRNLVNVVNASTNLIDLSKLVIPIEGTSLVDHINLPTESISISIESSMSTENLYTATLGGIGQIGYTMLLDLSATLAVNVGDTLTISTNVTATVRGIQGLKLLLELPNNANHQYALGDTVNITGQTVTGTVAYTTNHVGSLSKFMVVGAAHPEYTEYYKFPANTLSSHPGVEVLP